MKTTFIMNQKFHISFYGFIHSIIALFFITLPCLISAQTTLYSEGFETDGEGVRYTSNTYNFCSGVPGANPDYFLRVNTNPALPPGTCSTGHGTALTNLQGSWYWASEDIRSNLASYPGALPPGDITTSSINIAGYNNLTVSLYLATSNNNNVRWEDADSINIKASINGGGFITIGRFMGDNVAGGRLRIDGNLDGAITGADPVTTCDQDAFTNYTFSIPGTGSIMNIKLDFDQWGGSEELGIDLIEVKGNAFLPIELTGFTAQVRERSIDLLWQTASELKNEGFEIERSGDAKEWSKIGFIPGHGTSTMAHSYSFTDLTPLPSTGYYRIKQIDFDGRENLSSIVSAYFPNDSQEENSVIIAPNPVYGDEISFTIPESWGQDVNLILYGQTGQLLYQKTLNSGVQSLNINGLSSGNYTLCFWNNSKWTVEKVLIWR